jgi:CTP:molybdopterin cytidylyltransferase MocA
MARIAGAVLAAGSGTRMGTPKAELVVAGERLLDRAIRVLRTGGCVPVLAVVRQGTSAPGTRTVVNPDPARGMRSSLAHALDALDTDRTGADAPEALAVLLVDLPGVGPAAVRAVLDAWRPGRIAVATYPDAGTGTRAGHPLVMAPELWRAALELAGADEGARRLLRTRPDLVDEVPVDGDPHDLDTAEDLRRWQAGHAPPPG